MTRETDEPQTEDGSQREAIGSRADRWVEQKPAFAIFRDAQLQVPCMIIDMSAVGACIGLPREGDDDYVDPQALPEILTLDVRHEATEVDCKVVWRSDNRLGLQFLSSPQPY